MATYNPKLSLSAAPGVTGHLLLVLYEATAPTVPVVMSAQIAPPHTSSIQIQFTGLNPVNHIAKLFETNGTSTSGTVLANFSLDPQFPVVELRPDLFIYADEVSSPGFVSGTKTYTAPADYLDGWDYALEIRGIAKLDPDRDYQKDIVGNPTIIDNTTFNPGVYSVQPGEVWIFTFAPKVITYSNAGGGSMFTTTELITANRTLIAADVGKALIAASATSTLNITLPLLASIPENKPTFIMCINANNPNTTLLCQGSDTIVYLDAILNRIVLAGSESIWIYKWNNTYHILNELTGVKNVGDIVQTHKNDFYNTLFCNGQLVDRDVYPRLWSYVQSLDASTLVSDATWLNTAVTVSLAKFSTGNGSTTFRLPRLWTAGFLRGVDGSTRKAGSFEIGQNFTHDHATHGKGVMHGGSGDFFISNKNGAWSQGVGNDNFGRSGSVDEDVRTGDQGGSDGRPSNFGVYLSIRI